MPVLLVVPVTLIAVLAVGAFALRRAEGHAAELREARLLLLVLAAVSAGAGLLTLGPIGGAGEVVPATAASVAA
jgi:hypothetical protein